MGPMRSRTTCLSLSPQSLLLTPRSHHSLCRLLALLGLPQALCPPRLAPAAVHARGPAAGLVQTPRAPVLLSLPQTPVSIWQTATPPPPAPSAFQGPILAFLCNSGHPKTKPAICNNQRKVSSRCCLGALRPLLSSILPSSVGVLHLTPWTRGEDMRGRVSQEEGRSGDAGGAQLGTERVSSLETPSCPGSAQAFGWNRSALAALTNPMENGA